MKVIGESASAHEEATVMFPAELKLIRVQYYLPFQASTAGCRIYSPWIKGTTNVTDVSQIKKYSPDLNHAYQNGRLQVEM